ncbi:MAG TPA: flagellar hook capping FlgD N-terminal domain-containing protein [Chloroflexota bacterium]|nr:flagellar hook capping FlgD N-terminal domain-containing protein [Chloroflexota bacterium]
MAPDGISGVTGRTYMDAAIPGLNDTGSLSSISNSSNPDKSFPNLTPAQSAANAAAAGAKTTSTNGSDPLTQAAGGTLDKNAFLKLLVQELTNQDPLKPADNTQFIAQLAQFSTLEQMQNMSTGFTNMQTSFQEAQARGLLGVPITAVDSTTGATVNGTVDQILMDTSTGAGGSPVTTVKLDVNGTKINIGDVTSVGTGAASGAGSSGSSGGGTGNSGASLPGTLVPPSGSGN